MDDNEEFDEGVHALFGRVVAGTAPTVGFTPDDVAAGGRARLRRRRTASVAGGAASVTAIAIAAVAAGGFRTSEPAHPGLTPATSASTGFPPFDDSSDPDVKAAHQVFTTMMADLQTTLDPLHQSLGKGLPSVAGRIGGETAKDGLTVVLAWSAAGMKAHHHSGDPYLDIQFSVDGADVPSQLGAKTVDHGETVPWQHEDSKRLGDGSTVTWAWTVLPSGTTEMAAEHVYLDGRKASLHMLDASGMPTADAKPYQPFPFTTAALVAAVSDPTLKLPGFP